MAIFSRGKKKENVFLKCWLDLAMFLALEASQVLLNAATTLNVFKIQEDCGILIVFWSALTMCC